MTTGRYRRGNATLRQVDDRRSQRENNFFLAIIGLSLLVHTIVAALFLYKPASTNRRRPPALYVDLVMAPPVLNPQRGSAGAINSITSPAPAAKVAPVATPPQPQPQPTVPPVKVAKEPVVVKGNETKKAAVVQDDDIAADIARMKQRKAEQDELKAAQAAIAAMAKKTATDSPAATTVGSATGTGDEAGSAIGDWLQQAVKEKWTWTDRKRKDLSAEIEVNFASNGKIIGYRVKRSSGDARFDKSLTDAFIKLDTLPKPLGKPHQETFLFNLDDLQGQ